MSTDKCFYCDEICMCRTCARRIKCGLACESEFVSRVDTCGRYLSIFDDELKGGGINER